MDHMIEVFSELTDIPEFHNRISPEYLVTEDKIKVLQINTGRKCNLSCKHCHLNAGPERTEIMSREVMAAALRFAEEQCIGTIDITGGAPEVNPDIKWLITEAKKICSHVIVRSNLIIMTEEEYSDFPQFYADSKVELVCSLSYYRSREMDKVRGDGSFDKAVIMIKRLNELGYGRVPDLVLNFAYNPAGAFFPPDQTTMEHEFRNRLGSEYGIVFNSLFTLYNNPVGRFGEFLIHSGNLERYMKKLCNAYNPSTEPGLMCRYQLCVDYDGRVYDCDFNLAAGLEVLSDKKTIFDHAGKPFEKRCIKTDKHCYGCTAGAGSSCGGATE